MDELAYYFVKIIEEDQKRQRQGMRSCFEDPTENQDEQEKQEEADARR